MVSYLQLELESEWRDEYVSAPQQAFNERLRTFYHLSALSVGSKGDNQHLYGRHRSRSWDLNSRYCTDRRYATTATKDRVGDGNLLRASDIGISGPTHWAAARRLDEAVRAGKLPCIAEWFGTFDGQTVTGWFEGHKSSSDDSHLSHLHVGLWTQYTTDAAQLKLLGDIIIGVKPTPKADSMIIFGKDEDFNFYRCDGQLCTKVADGELENQTYFYAMYPRFPDVKGPVAGLVGNIYDPPRPTGKKTAEGSDILTYVDIFDMGYFGDVPL